MLMSVSKVLETQISRCWCWCVRELLETRISRSRCWCRNCLKLVSESKSMSGVLEARVGSEVDVSRVPELVSSRVLMSKLLGFRVSRVSRVLETWSRSTRAIRLFSTFEDMEFKLWVNNTLRTITLRMYATSYSFRHKIGNTPHFVRDNPLLIHKKKPDIGVYGAVEDIVVNPRHLQLPSWHHRYRSHKRYQCLCLVKVPERSSPVHLDSWEINHL
jgi:hypothetical protein